MLALVGGRNYGQSQLDHAVAKRPTGSIFKPFVYASAFNTAVAGIKLDDNGTDALFTPVTMLNDEQTTFTFGNALVKNTILATTRTNITAKSPRPTRSSIR